MKKIAILGFGTVGGGVGTVLLNNKKHIDSAAGESIEIKYILDRVMKADSPYFDQWIKDFAIIENDPEIAIVVETIGGSGIAYEFTKKCLNKGKSVITANKQLVAEHGKELCDLAVKNHCFYLFEASVGGGIPLLHPLQYCCGANEIRQIYGIMNGTTNFILTKMVKENTPFDVCLKEAQANGYAEADPTADVEGHDACRKTAILADLAWKREVKPENIPTIGISSIDLTDVSILQKNGYVIKLLGRIICNKDGTLIPFVSPHVVSEIHPISQVNDVFNAVVIDGNATDELMFYGKGAGALPTASAVLSDIITIVSGKAKNAMWADQADVLSYEEVPMDYYIRYKCDVSYPQCWKALSELSGIVSGYSLKDIQRNYSNEVIAAVWPVL